MPRILLTAFGPYDQWRENSSWLTMIELLRWLDHPGQLVTRRYPVDLSEVTERLASDLVQGFDYAIHLGQAPGSGCIRLESVAINAASGSAGGSSTKIAADGPAAYNCSFPLEQWSKKLRGQGVPAMVTFHAGTYLCNATMYLTHHLAAQHRWPLKCAFIHLPLAPHQVAQGDGNEASMSVPLMAMGVGLIIEELLQLPSQPRADAAIG
jgi:pyroglutamyl-peptidase